MSPTLPPAPIARHSCPSPDLVYPGLVKLGLVSLDGQDRLVWKALSAKPYGCSDGSEPLACDSLLDRTALLSQPLVQVAVALLIQPSGSFLMTSRPPGKVYAGYWEFPGGKFEGAENLGQALGREIQEELGVEVLAFEPWCVECVLYPHALVELHFCRVTQWAGELQMREGQEAAWQTLPLSVSPVLPGAYPVLDRLARD